MATVINPSLVPRPVPRSRVGRTLVSWLALMVALHGGSALAAVRVVGNLADTGPNSLRDTLQTAAAGDSIVFAPGLSGTITLGSTLPLTRDVVIDGGRAVTLDGNDAVGVLAVGAGVAATLIALTIQRGAAADGAGIASLGRLNLLDCIVRENHATARGGGLFVGAGSFTISRTSFIANEATAEGGAIEDLGNADSVIADSIIMGNQSNGPGAGIRHVSGRTLSILRSRISGNQIATTATLFGGGIASQSSVLIISDSAITGNKAHFAGGIYLANLGTASTLTLRRSLVVGNTAVSDGGGIFVFGGTATIENSTIANNLAAAGTSGGLAIQNSSAGVASVAMTHVTVAYNRATSNGGGMTLISGNLSLKNSLLAGNLAPTNADMQASFTSLGYNLVQARGSSSGYVASDLANGSNPNIAVVAFIGGPTSAIQPGIGSPAIDAIPPSQCVGITTDQRGYQRLAGNCDIGAIEVGALPPPALPDAVFGSGFE